jgi:hypothetical protein
MPSCRLCGVELRRYERAERECNACLRRHSVRGLLANPEPATLRNPDLARLDGRVELRKILAKDGGE